MVAGISAPTELGKENHQLGNLDFHVDRNRLQYGASGPGNDFTLQREHAIGCCNLLHHGRYDREQYRFRSRAADLFLYKKPRRSASLPLGYSVGAGYFPCGLCHRGRDGHPRIAFGGRQGWRAGTSYCELEHKRRRPASGAFSRSARAASIANSRFPNQQAQKLDYQPENCLHLCYFWGVCPGHWISVFPGYSWFTSAEEMMPSLSRPTADETASSFGGNRSDRSNVIRDARVIGEPFSGSSCGPETGSGKL